MADITCEVDNLPGGRDALHHDEEHDDSGAHEAEEGPVLDAPEGVDAIRAVQHAPEPEVLRLTGHLALGHSVVTGTGNRIQGTRGPGQRALQRVEEVEEAPLMQT